MLDADVVLFDLGRVLVDIDFDRCFAHWAAAADVEATDLRRRFRVDARFAAHERGELECDDFFAGLARDLDIGLDARAMRAGWNAIFGPPHADLPALLAALARHRPLYVLSNTNAAHAAVWRRSHAALLAPMRAVFTSHELGQRKPEAAVFETVAARIGVAPQRIHFLDDGPENLAGAARVGMSTQRIDDPGETAGLLRRTLASLGPT